MSLLFKPKSTYSNKDLLHMLSGNEQERGKAIKELFHLNYQSVIKTLAKHGGSEQDAKEVFQQVMLKLVVKSRDGSLPYIRNIGGYIFNACKNHWLNLQRRAKREDPITAQIQETQVEIQTDPHVLLENKDLKQVVGELLGQLGDKCKNLLYWSLGEGIDMKSVAKELKYENAQTAINIKARCKKRFKELVSQHKGYQQLVQQIIFPD